MTCLSTSREKEDCQRRNIFTTIFKYRNKFCKLVIDGGSAMNVMSTHTLSRAKLKTKPHPEPCMMSWLNVTTLPITFRYLVPIKIGDSVDNIWCDVFQIKIAHVISRRLLFDKYVIHFVRLNTLYFNSRIKSFKLWPFNPPTRVR